MTPDMGNKRAIMIEKSEEWIDAPGESLVVAAWAT
jgi:hypothetical protein